MCFPLHSSSPPPPPACQSPQLCPLSDLAFLQTYSRLFILLDTEETWMDPSLAQDLLLSSNQAPVWCVSRTGPLITAILVSFSPLTHCKGQWACLYGEYNARWSHQFIRVTHTNNPLTLLIEDIEGTDHSINHIHWCVCYNGQRAKKTHLTLSCVFSRVGWMMLEKDTASPQRCFLLKFMRPLCTADVLL